jgi:hypothetical protein
MSINSRLPPPRSPATPSGATKPIMMPWATSLASFSPDKTSMRSPHAFSARAMNSAPSSASRTAAVAKARTFFTSRMRAIERKRTSAASARSTASPPSLPVEAMVRPRPHRTFSLNSGVGERTAPSYTTSRTEFEPISMTPMGSSS